MNICRMEKAREREREKPSHAKRREFQGFFWLPLSYFAFLPLLGCLPHWLYPVLTFCFDGPPLAKKQDGVASSPSRRGTAARSRPWLQAFRRLSPRELSQRGGG